MVSCYIIWCHMIYNMSWYDIIQHIVWYDVIWYHVISHDITWYDMEPEGAEVEGLQGCGRRNSRADSNHYSQATMCDLSIMQQRLFVMVRWFRLAPPCFFQHVIINVFLSNVLASVFLACLCWNDPAVSVLSTKTPSRKCASIEFRFELSWNGRLGDGAFLESSKI